jgi:hypothetical protein
MERGSRGLELPESLYASVYIRDHEVPRIRYSINGHGLGSPADDDSAAYVEMVSNATTLFNTIQV